MWCNISFTLATSRKFVVCLYTKCFYRHREYGWAYVRTLHNKKKKMKMKRRRRKKRAERQNEWVREREYYRANSDVYVFRQTVKTELFYYNLFSVDNFLFGLFVVAFFISRIMNRQFNFKINFNTFFSSSFFLNLYIANILVCIYLYDLYQI